jgi:hypothetical protein
MEVIMFTLNNITKTADLRGYYVDSLPCPSCADVLTVEIPSARLFDYNQGAYAYQVFPDHTPDVWERFISGMCSPCWDAMFSFDEDAD